MLAINRFFYSIIISYIYIHISFAVPLTSYTNKNNKIRTPHLKKEDLENEDLLSVLSRNLPDSPHNHIFGKDVDATREDAQHQSTKRVAPLISVYVVSTNHVQCELLAKVWSTIPSRFFVMKGDDFFSKDKGRYDTMGTDRLATLTGAVHLHGHPALVFDGGTATTYSATDSKGCIMGGGIGPGIQSKFRSLTKDTAALPEITSEEVIARIQKSQREEKPIPTFARNTQEAMMADAFQEFALKGRNVIEQWLDKGYKKMPSQPSKFNADKHVICTGGDGDILMQLLQPNYSGIIEQHKKSNGSSKNANYVVEHSKHLIHYGIASVLALQVDLRKKNDAIKKNPNATHVGKRIAKHFEVEADDGDNIFRGKVVKVIPGDGGVDDFHIQYDDGDKEDVSLDELMGKWLFCFINQFCVLFLRLTVIHLLLPASEDMLKMFERHGEKKPKKAGKKKAAVPKKEKKKEQPTAATVESEKVKSSQTSDKEEVKKRKQDDTPVPSFPMKNGKTKAPPDTKKPAAKKPKKQTIASLVNSENPRTFVRKRVAKDFDGDTYFGTIMEYDDTESPPFWHVE